MKRSGRKLKKGRRGLVILAATLLALLLAFFAYANTYYHADKAAASALTSDAAVRVDTSRKGQVIFQPKVSQAGLIFYPGGKVEEEAYAPLMQAIARQGITCVLIRMPLRLAVFNINAAADIPQEFPKISRWYLAGHSLGGSMAASYLQKHSADYAGLFLMGSYSATDLSQTDLRVVSIYGEHDQVLNRNKYEESKKNYPADFTEYEIKGGIHSYFGAYGHQKGDGKAAITRERQMDETADIISDKIAK